jgi:hypothetical protein
VYGPDARSGWSVFHKQGRGTVGGSRRVDFDPPVRAGTEPDARGFLEPGDVAFWTAGHAIASDFGPMPVSRGAEIRLASPGGVFARTPGEATPPRGAGAGSRVRVGTGA